MKEDIDFRDSEIVISRCYINEKMIIQGNMKNEQYQMAMIKPASSPYATLWHTVEKSLSNSGIGGSDEHISP